MPDYSPRRDFIACLIVTVGILIISTVLAAYVQGALEGLPA